MTASLATIGLDERREALRHLVEQKLLKGYWVESESETEARVVALGRKQWLGAFGPRHPERREVVSVDEQGRTSVERLPSRRY